VRRKPPAVNFNKKIKMKKINFYCLCNFALIMIVLFFSGCGNKGFSVGGKVTFPDGTSPSSGEVMFTSGSFSAAGGIISDGTYNIKTKVPAGTYKVTVKAAEDSPADAKIDTGDAKPAKLLVDLKYSDPATSGLVCEVKGLTTFDIPVEKPAKK
jgi:hypothetical protein